MYSVMWSEHCSYKSSKVHLRYFGETTTDEMRLGMLAGIGENAGVVDIGDGWAVTFKVESHNHPSYVEPYQGAATGVGGIVRDIMAMGARPVAVMDQLRFGAADAPDTRRVVDGVVRGIGGYGNSLGLPNIGGETVFDASYAGNPLVNALCVGVLRKEDLHLAFASGTGNKIILFGARTGLDGIGGVSVLASETFGGDESAAPAARSCRRCRSVTHSWRRCSSSAASSCTPPAWWSASRISAVPDYLVPHRNWRRPVTAAWRSSWTRCRCGPPSMTPAEVLASESQERMCAVVTPENVDAFLAVCRKWDVLATVIGEVTDGDRLQITWHGETVVDVPPRTVAHEGPVYQRPVARPDSQDALNADTAARAAAAGHRSPSCVRLCLRCLAVRTCAAARSSPSSTTATCAATRCWPSTPTAACCASTKQTGRGIAVSTDASGRYTQLDPYAGAQLALAEAYRNVAVTGATPVAVTNCLNFGSPEDPGVMWQFSQAVRGLADGCAALGIPVTGGNVSFYNQTGSTAILPTPVVGVLGVIDDVSRRIPTDFGTEPGETLILLGDTRDEFDGSIWAQVTADHLGGRPPGGRPAAGAVACRRAGRGIPRRAGVGGPRPVRGRADPGGRRIGARWRDRLPHSDSRRLSIRHGAVHVSRSRSPRAGCWSPSRAPRRVGSRAMCEARGLPATRIGVVDQGSDTVEVQGQFTVSLAELRATYERRAAGAVRVGDSTSMAALERRNRHFCAGGADSRAPPAAGVGVGPGPAGLRRSRVRGAVLLLVADPVAAAARLSVPGPDRRDQRGDRLRHRRGDRHVGAADAGRRAQLVAARPPGCCTGSRPRSSAASVSASRVDGDTRRGVAAPGVGVDGHRGPVDVAATCAR